MWWKFLIVNQGVERIRIVRNKKDVFKGVVPAGFTWNLTVGDIVYIKTTQQYIRKLAIFNWFGKPSLVLYPPLGRKGHKVFMSSLPHVPGKTRYGKVMNPYKEER